MSLREKAPNRLGLAYQNQNDQLQTILSLRLPVLLQKAMNRSGAIQNLDDVRISVLSKMGPNLDFEPTPSF